MPSKAVFLDRDGTIIQDKNYIARPEQVELIPNAVKGMKLFKEMGYQLILFSNQAGIASGYLTEK